MHYDRNRAALCVSLCLSKGRMNIETLNALALTMVVNAVDIHAYIWVSQAPYIALLMAFCTIRRKDGKQFTLPRAALPFRVFQVLPPSFPNNERSVHAPSRGSLRTRRGHKRGGLLSPAQSTLPPPK